MRHWNPRTWVVLGFSISFLSVGTNVFVLAGINERLARLNSEHSALTGLLAQQATQLSASEVKYDQVRLLHWVARSLPKEQQAVARKEAAYLLLGSLTKTYAAIHDISPVTVMKTESLEMEDDLHAMQKVAELSDALAKSQDPARSAALLQQIQAVDVQAVMQPKTELGKKFKELERYALAEVEAADELSLLLKISPLLRQMQQELSASYQDKERRLDQLA